MVKASSQNLRSDTVLMTHASGQQGKTNFMKSQVKGLFMKSQGLFMRSQGKVWSMFMTALKGNSKKKEKKKKKKLTEP